MMRFLLLVSVANGAAFLGAAMAKGGLLKSDPSTLANYAVAWGVVAVIVLAVDEIRKATRP